MQQVEVESEEEAFVHLLYLEAAAMEEEGIEEAMEEEGIEDTEAVVLDFHSYFPYLDLVVVDFLDS